VKNYLLISIATGVENTAVRTEKIKINFLIPHTINYSASSVK